MSHTSSSSRSFTSRTVGIVAWIWITGVTLPPGIRLRRPWTIRLRCRESFIAHGPRVYAAPLWITHDMSLLSTFGGDLPYRDVVVIAGYPLNVLSITSDFVIYRERRSATDARGEGIEHIQGRVMPDDLRRWR